MSLTLRCSKYLLKYISEGEIKITVALLLKKEDTIKLNASKEVNPLTSCTKQWRIQERGRKKFFGDTPPPTLTEGLDDLPPSPLSGGLDPPLQKRMALVFLLPKLTNGNS